MNTEHDLSTSTLFKLSTDLSVLTILANNNSYAGVNEFILKAKLEKYPELGYFP
jgi:hypothetical protein